MKKIIKVRDGENVPDHYEHVSSQELPDPEKTYWVDVKESGIFPFNSVISKKVTPKSLFHLYEVEVTE